MIIADKTCPCFSTKISIEPSQVEYEADDETSYCERLQTSIYRKKPTRCMDSHPQVTLIFQIPTVIELRLQTVT